MTSRKAITDIMHAHIADIRQDAPKTRTQTRRSKGLEADRRRKIATWLERINMRLDELSMLSWRCDAGMNRAIWLAYAVFVVGLILIAAVLLGLLPV